MSRDLRELLAEAAQEPVGLPTTDETWEAGRTLRRRRRLLSAAGSALVVAGVAAAGALVLGGPQTPEIVDQPPATPTAPPTATPTEPTSSETEPEPAPPTLDQLAVASTMSLDDGRTYESRFPDGTVVRGIPAGATYPGRLFGLSDGTVAWLADQDVLALGPGDQSPTVLTPALRPDDTRIGVVGTGELNGDAVVLIEDARAASLADDEGGTVSAYRLDGTHDVVLEFESAWEAGIDAASLRDGWLLYTRTETVNGQTVLRAPDGTETVVDEWSGEGEGSSGDAALAAIDVAPGIAIVSLTEAGLEVRSVDDPTGEPVRVIPLPTDGIPKQLTVAGEWAYLTLLPDVPELLQVDLHTGDVERFSAPGIVALHEGLRPRPADAAPPADCADRGGSRTDDAQAYVWLPCPAAATHEEGAPPDEFWGIHKLRLVTDPRASSGGVAQRVEAMLEAIFAGPTAEEQEQGYSPIIDPSVDALAGVSFADGLVTIDLTEDGARAASIGTSARGVFQNTVNAAVFGGFVDADAVRITVEGDCVAWSTYGEGSPGCPTWHRDGRVTSS